jgi:lipopolysaccharide biosynthesis regulator YciM
MLELLFLLLPIAAAYGWFMGRNSVRTEERKEQKRFSKQYATGINLLLSDQPDKAVDLFVELLDVDSETIETHWTLGKLFRRRGEVDRAIKIHKNLTSLPSWVKTTFLPESMTALNKCLQAYRVTSYSGKKAKSTFLSFMSPRTNGIKPLK